ncbi:MAG: hypothetical protein NT118_02270 [Lentisphaerae bacterium]|nr:hypothetical protein [Lentisphaerota bacterium]
MKNVIKITAISSLLIIACLMIGACGSGGSQLTHGQGDFNFYVINSSSTLLSNVQIVVRESSATGTIIGSPYVTTADGHYYWVSPTGGVANDYYFTFTDQNSPVRYAPQTLKETPDITLTQNVNVTMVP